MSSPDFMSNGVSLGEKITKYETVRRDNCKACGNPWWFDMLNHYECTTCFHTDEPGGWPRRDRIPIINKSTMEDTMSEEQEDKAAEEATVEAPAAEAAAPEAASEVSGDGAGAAEEAAPEADGGDEAVEASEPEATEAAEEPAAEEPAAE